MIIQPVISQNKGNESYWIAFLCFLILAIGALLLPFNSASHQHQQLKPYQVEVSDLTSTPLAMIGELRLAHEEIYYSYQANSTWMSVSELEENWIAPFVKDKTWQHQGQHQWSLVASGTYQSNPAQGGVRYLLNSQNSRPDIWLDLEQKATLLSSPELSSSLSPFDAKKLIESGWTQVVFAPEQNKTPHSH